MIPGQPVLAPVSVRWPDGPQWRGASVVIMASGPSLTREQAARVLTWRAAAPSSRRVVVINTTFRMAPWADALYASDAKWWDMYLREVRAGFAGELWTQDVPTAKKHGIRCVASLRGAGLCRRPGVINQGQNSGYQAIGFAWQAGAARIVLLGYDMRPDRRIHWHGPHPGKLNRPLPYEKIVPLFVPLAADLQAEGCSVVNATPDSALSAFPRAAIADALAYQEGIS